MSENTDTLERLLVNVAIGLTRKENTTGEATALAAIARQYSNLSRERRERAEFSIRHGKMPEDFPNA